MASIRQIRDKVRNWRKTGKSFAWIAAELGVSKPEARRLENPDHVPGLKVQQQLGIVRHKKPAWVKEAVQNLQRLLEQKNALS